MERLTSQINAAFSFLDSLLTSVTRQLGTLYDLFSVLSQSSKHIQRIGTESGLTSFRDLYNGNSSNVNRYVGGLAGLIVLGIVCYFVIQKILS
jgi:hypothetical protein